MAIVDYHLLRRQQIMPVFALTKYLKYFFNRPVKCLKNMFVLDNTGYIYN